ncbi:MAG: type II toxin-antitoxin system MqsR family toxin [Lysobacteraceae bacterium]
MRAAIVAKCYRFTHAPRVGALALGLDEAAALKVIVGLRRSDLHKSMTNHADHRLWQDVYRASTPGGDAYIKLTLADGLLIVSFKER